MNSHLCALLLVLALRAPAQDVSKQVDALFASPGAASPGCAVGVAKDGKTLLAKGYGLASLEHGVPLSPQSAFYMASVSKQFMAFAILLLAEEGKLRLDDPVSKYIRELPSYAGAITIRHLLHHTSGLRDYLMLGTLAGYASDHVWTDYAARRMLARQKALNFEPGAEWMYSNSGYVMLAWIAESASGRRLNDWSQERIFRPLGMLATRWQQYHADPVPQRAAGHLEESGKWRIGNSMLDTVGDGGLYSTVEDMLKWNANFETRQVGGAALDQMMRPGMLAGKKPIENGYGMGLFRGKHRGLPTVSHGGALAGYRTAFLRFPEQRFAAIVLCNRSTANATRLAEQVAAIWLGSQMQPAAPEPARSPPAAPKLEPLSASDREGWAGEYFSEELGAVMRVDTAVGGEVRIAVGDLPATALVRQAEGGIAIGTYGITLTPRRDGAGRVTSFTLDAGRVRGILYQRR